MKVFLDLVEGVIMHPKKTLRETARNKAVTSAIGLYLLVLFFSFSAQIVANGQKLGHLLIGLPFFLIMMVVALFFYTAILQMASEFLGGKGKGIELFIALALANVPYLFAAPVALLERVGIPFLTGIAALINLGLFIWSLGLNVLAIREIEEFSTGKSLFLIFLPWIMLFSALVIFILLLIMVVTVLGIGSGIDFHQFIANYTSA